MSAGNASGSTKGGLRRLAFAAVAALVSCLLALAVAEAALAVADYEYSPLRIDPIKTGDWRQQHAFGDEDFVFDPDLLWRPRPGHGVFNEQGFRGELLAPEKPAGRYRIFALGDSNTLGWRGDGPNWPQYLEDLLRARHTGVTVTNAGAWGYSSYQGVRRLEEALAREADMVLVCFGSNDALQVSVSDADYARRVAAGRLLSTTRVGSLLLSGWDRLYMRDGGPRVPRVSLEEFRDNLTEMIGRTRDAGVRLVVLTRPFVGDIRPDDWKRDARLYNREAVRLARAHGLPAVDLYERFRAERELFADESHFNEQGHRLAARAIAEVISEVVSR